MTTVELSGDFYNDAPMRDGRTAACEYWRRPGAISGAIAMIPIAVDPPKHAHYRRILDPMLGPKRVDRLEDDLRAQVRAHVDAFAGRGS
ncbi:hypothetical protein [Mycobacterium sp.]|uniref:hypothetical protein n=1 Tax=Mycobacterium sp. TaxID=1785 RepID=UPI002C4895B6|nr:hypothetical protein [Mycobacterium sp.]HME47936.1 hypothetical protein [Mycobacterium sp.]